MMKCDKFCCANDECMAHNNAMRCPDCGCFCDCRFCVAKSSDCPLVQNQLIEEEMMCEHEREQQYITMKRGA